MFTFSIFLFYFCSKYGKIYKGENMLQYDLVNVLIETLSIDGSVEACFLKGSLARGEEDQHSNVDFYCVVKPGTRDVFLNKRIKYLETFNPIKHYFEINNEFPQIICIYENEVIVSLYTVTIDEIDNRDQILAIYDPKDILSNFNCKSLALDSYDLGEIVNYYSLNCLDFHKAYLRGDLLLSFRIANNLHSFFIKLTHFYINPNRAKLGLKQFERNLDPDKAREIIALTKLIKYEAMLIGVKTITVAMQDTIVNLPISETMHIDFDFFLYAKKQIFSIDEE